MVISSGKIRKDFIQALKLLMTQIPRHSVDTKSVTQRDGTSQWTSAQWMPLSEI
jgi:hypothetical protein